MFNTIERRQNLPFLVFAAILFVIGCVAPLYTSTESNTTLMVFLSVFCIPASGFIYLGTLFYGRT
jgi:hypothetical protein